MSHLFLEGNLTSKKIDFSKITGISISPKTNNCIIKVWTNTCNNIDSGIFRDDNFFKNYVFRNFNKNYRIHCIKYETLWENLELIFDKLKIPKEICDKFQKKYVKELSDKKKEIKKNLEKKYSKMEKCIDLLPPYFLIKPRR